MLDDMLAEAEDEHTAMQNRTPRSGQEGGRVMDMKPSELAAKYGVDMMTEDSDDDDFGPDDDDVDQGGAKGPSPIKTTPDKLRGAAGGGNGDGGKNEFGALTEMAQQNTVLRQELDERRQQVRKLGVMLEALAPAPGLDAERLLDVLEGTDVEHADPRDVKIVSLAKKSRNLALENARLKDKAKAAATAK